MTSQLQHSVVQVLTGLFTIFQSPRMSVRFLPKIMKSCLNLLKLWSKYHRSLFYLDMVYISKWTALHKNASIFALKSQ